MSVELELQLERQRLAPGEEVRGEVVVTNGGNTRSIAVSLALVEITADCRHPVAGAVESGPLHTGPVQAGKALPFALRVPPDAPPGHRSSHGRLVWVISAVCDQPRLDARVTRELDVVGREAADAREPQPPTLHDRAGHGGFAAAETQPAGGGLATGALIALMVAGWLVLALVLAGLLLL